MIELNREIEKSVFRFLLQERLNCNSPVQETFYGCTKDFAPESCYFSHCDENIWCLGQAQELGYCLTSLHCNDTSFSWTNWRKGQIAIQNLVEFRLMFKLPAFIFHTIYVHTHCNVLQYCKSPHFWP